MEVKDTVRVYPKGHSRRTILLDLVQSMRSQVLELGLVSGAELDELDAAARAHSMTHTRWRCHIRSSWSAPASRWVPALSPTRRR